MLVSSSMGQNDPGGYKRSNSLLNTSGKYPPRRTVTMNDNNARKKTLKLG